MRLSVRTRLTLAVGAVFALSAVVSAVVGVRILERRLVDATRDSAAQLLGDYLEEVTGGVAAIGVVGSEDTTRFFYLDDDGQEITEAAYFSAIVADFEAELAEQLPGFDLPDTGIATLTIAGPAYLTPGLTQRAAGSGLVNGTSTWPLTPFRPVTSNEPWLGDEPIPPPLAIDPITGELILMDGMVLSFSAGPRPVGDVVAVALDADSVGVAQTLALADGTELQVGVSAPLGPVSDSLDTLIAALWIVVPLLVLTVVFLTYAVAGRALRPVAAISNEAATITDADLARRVPETRGNDEVGHLASTVNGMLDRIEQARLQQRQLVADASHELRSPIAASRAQLEVALAGGAERDDLERAARVVLREQEQLGDLVDGLLALSRLDEGGAPAKSVVDVAELIRHEAARLTASMSLRLPETLPAEVQPGSFTRLARNLLDNAERHARSEVSVWAELIGSELVLEVADDGPGVPVEDRERIFDRFVRLDDARDRSSGGAGLGLAIVGAVVAAHGGRVTCDRGPLGGARFSVRLPVAGR